MIGRLQKAVTEEALILHTLIDIVINAHGVLMLLLKGEMMNDDVPHLAETKDASSGLVHKSRRPPRSCKDDAVHVLEVDARARAMNLCKNNCMTRSEKFLNNAAAVQNKLARIRKGLLENLIH